jgi:cytochrome c-type biogenesis protein CcmH
VASAVLLLVVATFDSGPAVTDGERIQALQESFACPECAGQSVAESNAGVAATIRQLIAEEVRSGASNDDIRNRLIDAYGTDVLLTPPSEGVSSLIWILPVVVLFAGCAGLGVVLTRQRGGSRDVTEDDEDIVAKARASFGS